MNSNLIKKAFKTKEGKTFYKTFVEINGYTIQVKGVTFTNKDGSINYSNQDKLNILAEKVD